MYLMREKNGFWHVIHFRTVHPIQFELNLENGDNNWLKFINVGGILDIKVFIGDDTPDSAIKLYHEYINGYALPPFFAFGYH